MKKSIQYYNILLVSKLGLAVAPFKKMRVEIVKLLTASHYEPIRHASPSHNLQH